MVKGRLLGCKDGSSVCIRGNSCNAGLREKRLTRGIWVSVVKCSRNRTGRSKKCTWKSDRSGSGENKLWM
jgi:hypothetical protein